MPDAVKEGPDPARRSARPLLKISDTRFVEAQRRRNNEEGSWVRLEA